MSKIFVTSPSMPSLEEYTDEIKDIWESRWLTNMGAKHEELRKGLKEYLGVSRLELFTNGHMALELLIQAMGLTGEVITTPFTFASTTHAIVRNGLTPVFCDIDPATYTMDPSKIEALITEKTSCIIPVHVYGNMCNTDAIEEIARKHGLKVIYDAAHTFGVKYKGRGAGSYGDASIFSFHATKVYNTIEGGAVAYKDDEVGEKLYELKNFGIHDAESVPGIGANAKMNEFAAAMGICNLRHIDEEIAKRKKVYERYMERLEGCAGLKLPYVGKDTVPNYAYFPVVFEDAFGRTRDEVFDALASHDIVARKYFYPITSSFEAYRDRFKAEDTPVALDISKRVLTLPMYAGLDLSDVDMIADVILMNK
ncbi:MAG: DegT/DnrJ/EryC1/StrS family aminotransferase [Eubacterium sp.]|nr:DegT/DnrJ/EryC1/StrS family aminotransferase [Eubacterium sp.]MCR5293415.1 DegT/DnrJ/EryC1/StrS family aminotransferase [Eubacterium sp.]